MSAPSSHEGQVDFDYVLVGGGLQSGLIVQALRHFRPDARIAVCEREARLGGNHTWSFHEGDVPGRLHDAVEPLVVARWPGYDVHFPGLSRHIPEAYATISSERFDAVIRGSLDRPGSALFAGAEVIRAGAHEVVLADGRHLKARAVIEARGPGACALPAALGFQKFVGLEVRLANAVDLPSPLLMEARVPQSDGYRFVYVLPLAPDRLLVEDTSYSDTPGLDVPAIRAGLHAFLSGRGLEVAEILREEQGVLPLPLGALPEDARDDPDSPLRAGYQGGWFHPTTGYSLPVALRLAEHVATVPPEALRGAALDALRAEVRRNSRYCRFLNRLLFQAFPPHERWRVLARFYRLPAPTIRRFYALSLTRGDCLRILCGRPPRGLSPSLALRARAPRPAPAVSPKLPEVT